MLQLIITVGSQFVYVVKCVHAHIHTHKNNFSKVTKVLLKITWEFPEERQLTLKQQGFEPHRSTQTQIFFNRKYYDPRLVESTDAEGPWIWRADSTYTIFWNMMVINGKEKDSMEAGCARLCFTTQPWERQGTESLSVRQQVLRSGWGADGPSMFWACWPLGNHQQSQDYKTLFFWEGSKE